MLWRHFFHEDDNPRLFAFLAVSNSAFDFASLVPPWGRGNGTVLDWIVFGAGFRESTAESCGESLKESVGESLGESLQKVLLENLSKLSLESLCIVPQKIF